VGFVVDEVALGQVCSAYFGFPCQSSFRRLLTFIIYHTGLVHRPEVAAVPSGFSPTPLIIIIIIIIIIVINKNLGGGTW
jgi:hypothetical protein